MNNWLIPLGLGAVVAAVVIATKKDTVPSGTLPPARTNPNIRTRTPGFNPNYAANFPTFDPGLGTIGPPPGWSTMNDQQRAQFCWQNLHNPAWANFCAVWANGQVGF